MSNEVIEHIKKINEESRRQMAENPGLYIGMLTENPEWWAEYETVEDFERAMAIESYINVYKSYVGIKPRWETFAHADDTPMTSDEINTMTAVFAEAEERYAAEQEQARVKAEQERKARVNANRRKCTPTLGDLFGDLLQQVA